MVYTSVSNKTEMNGTRRSFLLITIIGESTSDLWISLILWTFYKGESMKSIEW